MAEQKELTVPRNVTLYPRHLDAALAVSEDHDYNSVSAGIRRIIDEWLVMKRAGVAVERKAAAHD